MLSEPSHMLNMRVHSYRINKLYATRSTGSIEDSDDDDEYYNEIFNIFKTFIENEIDRKLTEEEEKYFKFDILQNTEKYSFLLESDADEIEEDDEFVDSMSMLDSTDARQTFEEANNDPEFRILAEGIERDNQSNDLQDQANPSQLFKDPLNKQNPDDLGYLYNLDPNHPLYPLERDYKDLIDFSRPEVVTALMSYLPYSPVDRRPASTRERSELIKLYQEKNAWIYSGCYYDTSLLNEPAKYLALGLLTEQELEGMRSYVTIRRHRTFNGAKSQGLMSAVYLTLVPSDPSQTITPYGNSFRTSLPYATRLDFEYIRNLIKGWEWVFTVNGVQYKYHVLPDSVSEKNTRKGKKR